MFAIIKGILIAISGAVVTVVLSERYNKKEKRFEEKMKVQLKVASITSEYQDEVLELINEVHEKVEVLYTHRRELYDVEPEDKKLKQDLIDKSREELDESINKLDVKIIAFIQYLDANEIVLKQFYNDYLEIHESFVAFYIALERFSLDYSDTVSFEEYLGVLESTKLKVNLAKYKLLSSLSSFNKKISKEFYEKNIEA